MNWIIITYLAYLAISIALTVWVARTLQKNGRIFLVDSFLGNEKLADSVNHLLVVGFYFDQHRFRHPGLEVRGQSDEYANRPRNSKQQSRFGARRVGRHALH